jgi:hypothetical protein
VGVKGNISIAAPYLPSDSSFTNVYGLRTAIGFVEDGFKDCASLKGYSYFERSKGEMMKAAELTSEMRLELTDL